MKIKKILITDKKGLDKVFGFVILKVINPTALSVRRDGSLFLI